MKKLSDKQVKMLEALAAKPDSEIDLSEIPEVASFKDWKPNRFYRPVKKPVTVRYDSDVIAWFKMHSKQYQTEMNKVLRNYMIEHLSEDSNKHLNSSEK